MGSVLFLNLTVDQEEAEALHDKSVIIAIILYRMVDLSGPLEWGV